MQEATICRKPSRDGKDDQSSWGRETRCQVDWSVEALRHCSLSKMQWCQLQGSTHGCWMVRRIMVVHMLTCTHTPTHNTHTHTHTREFNYMWSFTTVNLREYPRLRKKTFYIKVQKNVVWTKCISLSMCTTKNATWRCVWRIPGYWIACFYLIVTSLFVFRVSAGHHLPQKAFNRW